jgi:hypothetical protein
MPPVMPILNLTRVSEDREVIYKDQDNYTNPGDGLKDFVSSLLIDPVLKASVFGFKFTLLIAH